MPKNFSSKSFYRIVDANINRAKEGLRVLEEFTRFILNDYLLTSNLKNVRHELEEIISRLGVTKFSLIEKRDSRRDVGKDILGKETQRRDYPDILLANTGRVKESIRVLEEFSKLLSKNIALKLKKVRYSVYDIEKKIVKKIKTLRNIG